MANAVLLRRKMQNMDREPGTNQGTIWRMKQTSRLLIRTRAQGLLWRNHWNHQSSLGRVKMTTWIKGFWEELRSKCIAKELLELWSPASESQPLRFSLPLAVPRQEEAACPPLSPPKHKPHSCEAVMGECVRFSCWSRRCLAFFWQVFPETSEIGLPKSVITFQVTLKS